MFLIKDNRLFCVSASALGKHQKKIEAKHTFGWEAVPAEELSLRRNTGLIDDNKFFGHWKQNKTFYVRIEWPRLA